MHMSNLGYSVSIIRLNEEVPGGVDESDMVILNVDHDR